MRATGSIQSLMETTLETIKGSIDANTIIGDPIKTETTVVVPISKVTIGFGIGGGEYSKGYDNRNGIEIDNEKNDTNFAGGSAGAISVQPVAFVVVEDGETRLMSLDDNLNLVDNILAITPRVIEKIQKMNKEKCNKNNNHKDKKK
ncbi:GerW family sporulation protein [Romboutsia hominis]|uniref:GerW family sporulation protein n=1 Tax=Romboutsia faecis TaxID=2764597 RepID=A0ABR7JML3_9FIRM|nr:GerW family sporulation protein [Romboutsia faecis]MBC5996135.1 GerW family sporulation protein [Romboutsia faecis]